MDQANQVSQPVATPSQNYVPTNQDMSGGGASQLPKQNNNFLGNQPNPTTMGQSGNKLADMPLYYEDQSVVDKKNPEMDEWEEQSPIDPLNMNVNNNDQAGGWHKEAEPITSLDSIQMMEVDKAGEFEPEVESWLEKLEKAEDVGLDKPVKGDDGQVLVANATNTNGLVDDDEVVVLPLSFDEVERGMHMKVYESARWLAEWCVRVVKIFGNKVRYK